MLRGLASDRRNLPIDVLHLAEEVEDLGQGQRHACRSQVRTIIEHLLKLQLSPRPEPRGGWERRILMARTALGDRLTEPLEHDLEANLQRLNRHAATLARQSWKCTASVSERPAFRHDAHAPWIGSRFPDLWRLRQNSRQLFRSHSLANL